MKYLPLYYEWAKRKKIPNNGLCLTPLRGNYLDLFAVKDINNSTCWYWGYDGEFYYFQNISSWKQREIKFRFTPVRQNIMLFICAMNGEL